MVCFVLCVAKAVPCVPTGVRTDACKRPCSAIPARLKAPGIPYRIREPALPAFAHSVPCPHGEPLGSLTASFEPTRNGIPCGRRSRVNTSISCRLWRLSNCYVGMRLDSVTTGDDVVVVTKSYPRAWKMKNFDQNSPHQKLVDKEQHAHMNYASPSILAS